MTGPAICRFLRDWRLLDVCGLEWTDDSGSALIGLVGVRGSGEGNGCVSAEDEAGVSLSTASLDWSIS